MVKRTITITTILLILSMIVSLIIVLNKSSFAADGDIASGTSGTCSWVIDSEGVLTINPTDGVSGQLETADSSTLNNGLWYNYRSQITKVEVEEGVSTSNGIDRIFYRLDNCTEMDLSKLNTSECTTMKGLFTSCSKLTSLDLSSWNTSKVTNMEDMFSACDKLETINTIGWDTSKVTSMTGMFSKDYKLATVSGIEDWNVSSVTSMNSMFYARLYQSGHYYERGSLLSLNLSNWNVSNLTSMISMFGGQHSMESLNLANWNTEKITSLEAAFQGCSKLNTINFSNWDVSKVTSLKNTFRGCSALTSLDIEGWNTTSLTDLQSTFYGCGVTQLDLNSWNTSKIKTLDSTFYNCSGLSSLNISNWDVTNVTTLYQTFSRCTKLSSIDLSNWNTLKATNMSYTFYGCSNITSINLSNWNTSNANNMSYMFSYCTELPSLDLTSFNTNKVIYFENMFENCAKMISLNISGFTSTAATNMHFMFYKMNKLNSINLGTNWSFKGNNITNTNNYAYLPVPAGGLSYTHKWIKLNTQNNPYDTISLTNLYNGSTMAGVWVWEEGTPDNAVVKYAVSLLGIEVNIDDHGNPMGLSFGPALGNNYVNSYKSHSPSGTTAKGNEHRCIHDDDWTTIINWNKEDPYVYEQCVQEGCTHSVEITTPTDLRNINFPTFYSGDGPSVLSYELYDIHDEGLFQHLTWQAIYCGGALANGTSFGGWGGSRIRAMMNGYNSLTLDELGHNVDRTSSSSTWTNYADPLKMNNAVVDSVTKYVEPNTLLSGFPQELRNAIGKTSIKYDKVVNGTGFYKKIEPAETDDYLWLLSTNEVWQNPDSNYNHPNEATEVYPGLTAKSSKIGYSVSIYTGETIPYSTWLRSPYITSTSDVGTSSGNASRVDAISETGTAVNYGSCRGSLSSISDVGISPCFALGNNYDPTWTLTLETGEGSLDTKYYDSNGSSSNIILQTPEYPHHYIVEWNTEADGSGDSYNTGDTIEMHDGDFITLYAIYAINKHTVSYSYTGNPPEGASELPTNCDYEYGNQVTVANNATAPGYDFDGWSRQGTFEMPDEDVQITGKFTPRTDTLYKVEHYLEDLKADTYTLKKTDNLTGTTDTEVTAEEREYEGFTFDSSINGTKLSGNIAGDGSLVLKLYYKRNSYNVTYSYTGDIPDDASALPQQETYEYGEELNVPEEATAEGYTFSGWIKDYINMPAKDIEITGYFIENPKSYRYKVEYFFDGELDDTLDEILNAEKDEEISIIPQTPLRHGEKNYTLVSNNHKITITVNDEDNVIKVYYETDVLDYAIDNFEDESAGDGISDKYQIRITYKVENGSWNDGTNNNKVNVITLYDKDGNPSENGTGSTKIPEVGSKPNQGYTYGYWNKNIPSKVTNTDDGKEYVYSYEIVKTIEADIAGGKGKSSNPKTDDVMNRYLLAGVGGILVLMLVSRIRRRYSRKAKKIRF